MVIDKNTRWKGFASRGSGVRIPTAPQGLRRSEVGSEIVGPDLKIVCPQFVREPARNALKFGTTRWSCSVCSELISSPRTDTTHRVDSSVEASNRGLARRLRPVGWLPRGDAERHWRTIGRGTGGHREARATCWDGSLCEALTSALVSGRSSVRLRPWAQDQEPSDLLRRYRQDHRNRSCEASCGHRVDMIFVRVFGGPMQLRHLPGRTGLQAQSRTVGSGPGALEQLIPLTGELR
jgi:hypothetical protein